MPVSRDFYVVVFGEKVVWRNNGDTTMKVEQYNEDRFKHNSCHHVKMGAMSEMMLWSRFYSIEFIGNDDSKTLIRRLDSLLR